MGESTKSELVERLKYDWVCTIAKGKGVKGQE